MVNEMGNEIRTRMALHGTPRASALAGALLCMTAGSARADDTPQLPTVTSHGATVASVGVDQRVRAQLRAVMTELVETGAFGDQSPQQISLAVDTPAERVSNLGLLVDSAHEYRDGLHVFGVTPGGGAERIGVRAGDVLVALNGNSLADKADAASEMRRSIGALPDGSPLAFDIRRNGQAVAMSGALSSVYLPPMRLMIGTGALLATSGTNDVSSGCGRITEFDVAPRQQHLHAAKIISIDGVAPGPTGTMSYRVKAGQHVLKVAEGIESRYLSFGGRMHSAASVYKSLTIDVPPDTTILIAARLNEDKRNEPKDGAFWDPVAWKQVAEPCR
jgi:membrane-associated protease RseP (regulator of RpoE activity)